MMNVLMLLMSIELFYVQLFTLLAPFTTNEQKIQIFGIQKKDICRHQGFGAFRLT